MFLQTNHLIKQIRMKRNIYSILIAVFAAFLLGACNDVLISEREQGRGYLSVSLQKDDFIYTKAVSAPSEDMTFNVQVFSGETMVASFDDHRAVNQNTPLSLPVGTYKVVASYGDNTQAGFDNPAYSGETEVHVAADQMVEAEIVCTLSNVMVTVGFDNQIKDHFTSYSAFIEDGNGNGVTFGNAEGNLDAVAYIPASGIIKLNLTLTNRENKVYNVSRVYSNVKAQQHYKFNFTMAPSTGETGYGAIRIVVDDTMIDQTLDLELDFSDSVDPSFTTNSGFRPSEEMTFMIGDSTPKVLSFDAPEGIESLTLSMNPEALTRAAVASMHYELVEASQDLINRLTANGFKLTSIARGATSATIDITDFITHLATGEYVLNIALYDAKGHAANCNMNITIMADVEADMVSVEPWAKFAVVKGKYFSQTTPDGLTFMYKKSSDASWTSFPASSVKVDASSKSYEAEIGGLDANSKYLIKAVTAGETDTREMEFSTESAENLYNMSFDDWYQDGKVWYPYKSGANPSVWDSANKATSSFGGSTTTPEESNVVSGKAARMESKYVVIAFAAGNIYTGQFGAVQGLGATLDWGASFSSRPMALRGHYNYSPASINRTKSPYENMKGTMDKCQIMVLLTDWDKQFPINTTEGNFVDLNNDSGIIAMGKLESDEATGGYREFVLPIEYRSTTRKPKYVVVVACSSYLGDYFTGGEGSVLYVDEFSFEYDATKLSDEQRAKINYR